MSRIKVSRQANLSNQMRVVVTGASSGIGYAQVKAFLNQGHLVLAVDRQPMNSESFLQSNLSFLLADVSQESDVQMIFQWVEKHWGMVDVLCNTAGVLDEFKPLHETDMKLWQDMLTINVTSMYLMSKAALPFLLKTSTSRMINMASIASLTAGGGGIAYTTAKHAVAGFTKQMAYDYARTGLRVNAIAAGAIQTAMTAGDFVGDNPLAEWVAEQVPIKRWAQPDEVAALTVFLASDEAEYMNGVILPLDGGWLIR